MQFNPSDWRLPGISVCPVPAYFGSPLGRDLHGRLRTRFES